MSGMARLNDRRYGLTTSESKWHEHEGEARGNLKLNRLGENHETSRYRRVSVAGGSCEAGWARKVRLH